MNSCHFLPPNNLRCLLGLMLAGVAATSALAEDAYEQAPIHYSDTTPKDAAQALQKKLASGKLKFDRHSGWSLLKDLMHALDIPIESQVMVFSKTSKQNSRISPETPRVVYFGDNAYVGYCLGGSIEVTTIDPELGPIFYLLDPDTPDDQPLEFVRDQSCLSCHGGPFSPDVPGILVRSVFPNEEGHPMMGAGSTVVGTTTPFAERWGGWYVTGQHGEGRHRGNAIAEEREGMWHLDSEPGANVTDLSDRFNTKPYPRAQSDIVALMVLEHQSTVQNALTKASQATRRAMHMQRWLQEELGEKVDKEPTGTARRIVDHAAEDVVDALLFLDEAELPEGGIEGDEAFQAAFAQHAPRTPEGRSLKDFQLLNRLFKYRCSYMIYSLSFLSMPPELKTAVMSLLTDALSDAPSTDRYAYLSDSERSRIREILAQTHPDAPAAWKKEVSRAKQAALTPSGTP
ncbi:MAG: hypothetical protein KDK99_10525 [Verrucomicrobiales bacterium]|nr:hypothetical protein [Verrucomicrobiales bacterium]